MTDALRCPACGEPMRALETGGTRVQVCGGCQGLWLSRAALSALGCELPAHRAEQESAPHLCPCCRTPLDRRDAHAAFLELCRGCGGIFLEAAQLAALSLPSGELEPPPPEDPSQREIFWCDLCHQPAPLAEQVIAERVTACPACAARFELRHEPQARLAAERENEAANHRPLDDTGLTLDAVLIALTRLRF